MNFGLFIAESTGLKALEILLENEIEIVYVCSEDKYYKHKISSLCKKNSIPFIFNPNKHLNKILKYSSKIDYLLSVFSRFIIPNQILRLIKFNCLNVHPGLLPYYPGTNSISGTIYNNEKITGITIHQVKKKIDSGDICLVQKIKIKKNELAISLWLKIIENTPGLIEKLILKLRTNKLNFYKNDLTKKKFFPNYIPNNGKVTKDIDKDEFIRMYRASYYSPFSSSWGSLNFIYKKKKYYIEKINLTKINTSKFITKISSNKFIINIKNERFIAKVR